MASSLRPPPHTREAGGGKQSRKKYQERIEWPREDAMKKKNVDDYSGQSIFHLENRSHQFSR